MTHNIDKHPALTHASNIADICKPLNRLNITYFAHVNIDKSGMFSALANNPEFTKHYLKSNYYNVDIHLADCGLLKNYIIWDSVDRFGESAKMHLEAGEYGVKHTFTIVEKNANGSNYYHFASNTNDNTINQVYLNNIDILKYFILYFKEKVNQSKCIASAYDMKFSIDENASGYSFNSRKYFDNLKSRREEFIDEIRLDKKVCVDISQVLSIREIQILLWLHHGKTVHDIARILKLADVTVNKRISLIKNKLQCYTQFQLGEKFTGLFSNSSDLIKHICNTYLLNT